MYRIGIFGGSFSPVHNGHIAAAKAFMRTMQLDILYVIPASIPPHKQIAEGASAADRMKMCELAFAGIDGVVVSDIEMKREGKSFTVDTLRELSGEDRRLFLLCGTDMILTLDEWKDPDEIFKLSYPVYIRREKDSENDKLIIGKIAEYNEKYGKVVRRVVADAYEISSTDVRDAVRKGKDISRMVPREVADYIRDNHLYV